jgi:hypothetical protein
MKKLNKMLMIGSAGANVGKTELACAILRKFSRIDPDIVGVKVTAINEKKGQCPRGGEGCGVCSSLDDAFLITEETDTSSGKDTSRLLAAGAARVYWLRVLRSHIDQGLAALFEVLGTNVSSICESNSLRHVVEPGLFLVAESNSSGTWKPSALQVKKFADRIIVSNGGNFDFDIDDIKLENGRWMLLTNRK